MPLSVFRQCPSETLGYVRRMRPRGTQQFALSARTPPGRLARLVDPGGRRRAGDAELSGQEYVPNMYASEAKDAIKKSREDDDQIEADEE